MATIRNTIALQDRMTPVLTAVVSSLHSTQIALAGVDGVSNSAFNQMQADISAAQAALNNLGGAAGAAGSQIQSNIQGAADTTNNLNRQVDNTEREANETRSAFAGWQAAIITANQALGLVRSTIESINNGMQIVDKYNNLNSRVALVNDGLQTQAELQDKIFLAAQRSYATYESVADTVAKLNLLAGDAFNSNDESIKFAEIMNKSFAVAGTEAGQMDAALLQMNQALASGRLQGDEYRSIIENAPLIANAIADYMGKSRAEMKELSSQGVITSDIIKAAVFKAGDDIEKKFQAMPMSFGQAMNVIQNEAIRTFEPVFKMISNGINSNGWKGFASTISGVISEVAGQLQYWMTLVQGILASPGFQQFAQTLVNSFAAVMVVLEWTITGMLKIANEFFYVWPLIEPVVLGVVAALTLYKAALMASAAWTAISSGVMVAYSAAQTLVSIGYGVLTGSTTVAAAAQSVYNATLLACPLTWIVLAIIAVITVIYLAVAAFNRLAGESVSATGIIVGTVFAAAAFIWNIVAGVINAIIGFIWTFADVSIGTIEWFLNAANGGFNSFGDAVANLIGNIISWFLDLGQVVTKIIDAIFGTDWTGGLESLKGAVLAWGKNDNSITLERPAAPELERWDYGNAFDQGYSIGDSISNWNPFEMPEMPDMPKLETGNGAAQVAKDAAKSAGDINDKAGGKDGGIKTKGEVEITDEDIKLLKDVAAVEWVNKFTTLKPEMTVTFGDVRETADTGQLVAALEEILTDAYTSSLGVGG